jgi:photosystem II stability/assembly factor-like uncharacterized protein
MKFSTNFIGLSLIILILLFTTGLTQEGWHQQTLPPQTLGLIGIHAVNSEILWVVGENGTIINSTDGGTSWVSISSGITENLNTVEFVNPDTGWVAGKNNGTISDSAVFRTMDGGSTWEVQPLGLGGQNLIYDVDFVEGLSGEPMRGFLTGGLTCTWRTDNYGNTWENVRGACGQGNFWSSCFVDKKTGWFVGTPSTEYPYTIMCTTDAGTTWTDQTNPTEQPLRGVCFATDQRGLAVGLVGTILYTSDGGANWEARPNNGYRWESVFLTESGKAWAVGSSGNIAYSTDWGYTWVAQESGVAVELWEVYFINDNEGWIVGGGIGQPGVILHTTTGGVVTDIHNENNPIIEKFRLSQNYPNPFNPKTKIEFQIPSSDLATLVIYDILGNKIVTLLDEHLRAGKHEVVWNAGDFPSGLYFYQLTSGKFNEVKKMLLIK